MKWLAYLSHVFRLASLNQLQRRTRHGCDVLYPLFGIIYIFYVIHKMMRCPRWGLSQLLLLCCRKAAAAEGFVFAVVFHFFTVGWLHARYYQRPVNLQKWWYRNIYMGYLMCFGIFRQWLITYLYKGMINNMSWHIPCIISCRCHALLYLSCS